MTRETRTLVISMALGVALLLAQWLGAGWLAERDPIAALLVERELGVAAAVAAVVAVRGLAFLLLPGWLLYCVVRVVSHGPRRRRGRGRL